MTGEGGGASRYALKPASINSEDILICVDVDAESTVEMKTMGTNGKPLIRLDCIKEAIILFVHNKLSVNPDHRFAFATLSKSAAWLKKEFTSDAESAVASVRGLSATKYSGRADLTLLFREAALKAAISRAQSRVLRVILIYCRSSMIPTHYWPLNQKQFTLDVMYLHDKPGPDNCPQDVYDSLVDIVEHVSEYEGYLFDSGNGVARSVFKSMSLLLSHPQQRCAQDDLDIPKSLAKKLLVTDAPAVSSDNSALNSKKEVKQPSEGTPTNKKRIHSLGKEKAPDVKNYDENLVGARIKVWWPLDREYYKGVVKSYDSAEKRHLVCYDDGDKELLEMSEHKWYFLKKSSEQHAEASQRGCDVEASTMPQKKKIKTGKEHSTNKETKMDSPSQMLSPVPRCVKKNDEAPQVSQRMAKQVPSSSASRVKKYRTEAVKSSSVSLDKHNDVVNSTCEGAFGASKLEKVTNEKEDRQGLREAAVQDKQKAVEVSTPEQTCAPKMIQNMEHSSSSLLHDSSVDAAITSLNENGHEAVSLRCEKVAEAEVKAQGRRTLEMVRPPVAEKENPGETETHTHKRALVKICSLNKAQDKMEKTPAEGEPSCRSKKSSAEAGDLQRQIFPQPCSVSQQLAKVKQSVLDSLATVRQFRSELEMKEQSIADTLSSVRQYRSEIKEKEDTLEASLLEIDTLGEKILGINKILNS